jgi:protein phosphatase
VLPTQPGDRWVICSDGLSSYVAEEKISAVLAAYPDALDAGEQLVKESLDQGAPDNVTVLVIDIDETDESGHVPPVFVGSASAPLVFEPDGTRRQLRLPSLLLHPLKATQPDPSHFEPESEEYLDELMLEDRRRARRRRISWLVFVGAVIAALVAAAVLGYQWTQQHYFVGAFEGRVAIYQGVQQDIGPIQLSTVVQRTTIDVDELPAYLVAQVESTINATDLEDAERIVDQLRDATRG